MEAARDMIATFDRVASGLEQVRIRVRTALVGRGDACDLALAVAVAGGPGLIVGPGGSGRSTLVGAMADAFAAPLARRRATPDMTLADLTQDGESDRGGRRRALAALAHPFALLESAQATPARLLDRVLEAVAAGEMDSGGERLALNPELRLFAAVEDPSALAPHTIDRFLALVTLTPARSEERALLFASDAERDRSPAAPATLLAEARRLSVALPVGARLVDRLLDVVRRARPDDPDAPPAVRAGVVRGPGPRAGQALIRMIRARALLEGRAAPDASDLRALAPAVLGPRLALSPGYRLSEILDALLP